MGLQILKGSVETVTLNQEFRKLELLPYITYFIPDNKTDKIQSPNDLPLTVFQPLLKVSAPLSGENAWLHFSIDKNEYTDDVILVTRLGNYQNAFTLYVENSSGGWNRSEYDYRSSIKDREFSTGEAALRIKLEKDQQNILLHIHSAKWFTSDWILFSPESYRSHRNLTKALLWFYISLILIFCIISLASSIIFRARLPAIFAVYALSMGLYILLESNKLTELFFPNHMSIGHLLGAYILGILTFSSTIYFREICKNGILPKWLNRSFLFLIILTIIYLITVALGIVKGVSVFSMLLFYFMSILFIWGAWINFRINTPMRWILAGIFIMIISGTLIDFHAQNFIYAPWSYYTVIPALTIELIFVAIGTLLAVNVERKKLITTRDQNIKLKDNVSRLQTEVDHTMTAYQALVNRSGKETLEAPESYFENPLSAREFQILHLLSTSKSNQEIADQLHLSRNTIKTHLKKIYLKLDAHDRKEAVERAKEYKLL
ncbi:MAG: HTH domain-containing protein [Saprospiraceae bacterium]|nr:HTH domain-containing protein [Saprospiraceae bacterium]